MSEIEALIDAAKAGDEPRVRSIVAGQPRVVVQRLPSGESPLMASIYRGHRTVAAALVELGAEVDVFAAAALGDVTALTRALSQPDAVNAFAYDGWTPLHLAAFFGRMDVVALLLDAGADPHAVSRNSLENTPLHAAAAGKHEEIALLLVQRGGSPDKPDAGGFTALQIARENGLLKFAQRVSHPRQADSG